MKSLFNYFPLPKTTGCLLVVVLSVLSYNCCYATELTNLNVVTHNNKISVNVVLKPEQRFLDSLSQGVSKEIMFYIDLFREWKVWPDEFVTGVKIKRTLKTNPIKREYIATSQQGNVITEKRFKDQESMLEWALSINNLTLVDNLSDYDAGTYYIKITAESRLQNIAPALGFFLFFIPQKEFSVSKESEPFQIKNR